jgi:hypothetical protein
MPFSCRQSTAKSAAGGDQPDADVHMNDDNDTASNPAKPGKPAVKTYSKAVRQPFKPPTPVTREPLQE